MTTPLELRARRVLRSAGYFRRWIILGVVIGIGGGLAAIAFSLSLELGTTILLAGLGGYPPATPVGEGGAPIPAGFERFWAIPLIVAFGGLVSGLIVQRWAPEAEGHGTDAAIAAFHHDPRGIRARVPLVKMVASAITIGSGGSGGREGPTAQIGAGFASFLSRRLDLDAREARIALAAGMAAGIGAIFRAPFGGAVLGAELMYRDDVESDALIPSFVASIVAYSVSGAVYGFEPIFGVQAQFVFDQPIQLIWYALIGLATGAFGLLYIRTFYATSAAFSRLALPAWLRPAIGGLLVGLLALAAPAILGTGYGWVQAAMDQTLLDLPLLLVLLLPLLKIVATSLSIGSGGSGGIFGPGMVIGGFVGAAIWRLLQPIAPSIPTDPGPFVIVGMMALFGSVAHAPIAVMLMVAEMTGNLGMVAPAMIAVGLATLIVGPRTIYHSQVATRAQSPAHRFRHAMPLLASLAAGDAARTPRVVLRDRDPAGAAAAQLERVDVPGAPVADDGGRYVGVATLADLRALAVDRPVRAATDLGATAIEAADGLDDALGQLVDRGSHWLPVVADRGRVVGTLSMRDLMAAYRRAMTDNVRRLRGIAGADALFELMITPTSPLAERTIAEVDWPTGSLVVSIDRAGELVHPGGGSRLHIGDRLMLMAPSGASPALRELTDGEESLIGPDPAASAPGGGLEP